MKKRILLIILLSLLITTGCEEKEQNTSNNNEQIKENNQNKIDRKVYKYMKINSANTSGLINVSYIFDDPSEVGDADDEYKPTLIVEFDQNTGKATSVKLYAFFLDYIGSSEWVDKAIEKFNESGDSYKKDFTNISKGRVNNNVTYMVVDINPSSYVFNQYIQILTTNQDIAKYKDTIFFSRLYNYSTEPAHQEGDNFFEESLEGLRIEWSDSELKSY